MRTTALRLLTRATRTDRGTWSVTAVSAWLVYLLTAHWQSGQVNDAVAAVWPAWQFVHTGSFDLSTAVGLPQGIPWFTELGDRVVSQRMMGVVLAGVPFAALAPFLDAEQVGALAGATYSALAVANVHLLLRALAPVRTAAAATVVFALGTPLWTTGAAELWPHGVDACFVSAAVLGLQRQRYLLAGLAMAPAVMTRPYLALSAAVLGAVLARTRTPHVLWRFGVPTGLSVPLLLLWNDWYYGVASLGGAYQGHIGASLAAPDQERNGVFLHDVAGAFLSPEVGLLCYTPLWALLLLRLRPAWRAAPDWVRAAALAGLVYQVLQLRGNRYSGGGGFYSNRLVVELVVLTAPLLLVAVLPLLQRGGARARVVVLLASTSVAIHLFGAFSAYHWFGVVQDFWLWYPWHVARSWGWGSLPLAVASLALPVLAVLLHQRHERALVIPAQRASAPAEPLVRS